MPLATAAPASSAAPPDRVRELAEALAGEAPRLIPPAAWLALDAATGLPDLQPLVAHLSIGIDASLPVPFRVGTGGHVLLAPGVLGEAAVARVILRHAAEVVRLRSLEQPIAAALLAARVAGLHLAMRPRIEREAVERALPPALLHACRLLSSDGPLAHVAAALSSSAVDLALLLQLGGLDEAAALSVAADLAARTDAANRFARLAAFAVPAEVLVTGGGDNRIAPLPETGRNAYGSSPLPVEGEIVFASSTASPVGRRQIEAIEALRGRLLTAAASGHADRHYASESEEIRRRVLDLTGCSSVPGTEAVLAASGTDAELIALSITLSIGRKPVTSILIDPNETGSGVPQAALGQHFSSRTAQGAQVEQGALLEGLAEGSAATVTVPLRDARGCPRPVAAIDVEVARHVVAALGEDRHVILHVLDSAKTGLGAPSPAAVEQIVAAAGGAVTVVVDACQMRLGRAAMRAYAERGWLLQITGSKFYSGPPFCGALIVPEAIASRLLDCDPAPAALGAYSGWRDWPARLAGYALDLSSAFNPGLLARWCGALAEADAFARIPAGEARAFLWLLARETAAAIAAHPELQAVEADPFDRSALGVEDGFAGVRSILPFLLLDGGGRPLPLEDAKRAHKLMMQPPQSVHLGQPVRMAHPSGITTGALRLCASARTVTDAFLDRTPEAVLADMRVAVAKAARLARSIGRPA